MSRRRLLLLLFALGAGLVLPGLARAAGECGVPTDGPAWIDFGHPAVAKVFTRPGVIVAASSGEFPAQLRAAGVTTLYWDMNLKNRIGVPTTPAPASSIVDRANRLFDFAAKQSGCDKPIIVLNELFGAQLELPWSTANAQYRENVLAFLRALSGRGARPMLLIPARNPYTEGSAADWWREAARYTDLVPEVYFSAPTIHGAGSLLGNRRLRTAMRRAVRTFTALGIPASKIGIVLGFQASAGSGGREGLEPASAWFNVVKWQVLAAQQIARETKLGSVLSWGWGSYRVSAHDSDKEGTACVYLWTRDPSLCDAPALAGPDFDTSLTDGQISLPAGQQCSFGLDAVPLSAVSGLTRLTGDREIAYSALLARIAESRARIVTPEDVLAAERAVIRTRFRGGRGLYMQALTTAGASLGTARAILADELRRVRIESKLWAEPPSAREVSAFYLAYPDLLTRAVEVDPSPWWLDRKKRGIALAPLAPEQVFLLPEGRRVSVRALDGTYTIRALGEAQQLGSLPLVQARPAIVAALTAFARRGAFERWTVGRQTQVLRGATCIRDDLPAPGTIRLTSYLPYLALAAA